MRKLLTGVFAVGLLATGALPAHAHPDYHYYGGCTLVAVEDQTPGGQLGGQDVWNGTVVLAVVATRSDGIRPAPTAPITASCEFLVNGVSQGTALGTVSGTGAVVSAGGFTFTAAVTDIVQVCEHVTVAGEAHVACHEVTQVQLIPQPLIDVLDEVRQTLDPWVCFVVGILAPGIPPVVTVSPEGDVFVSGTKYYDCPPYGN